MLPSFHHILKSKRACEPRGLPHLNVRSPVAGGHTRVCAVAFIGQCRTVRTGWKATIPQADVQRCLWSVADILVCSAPMFGAECRLSVTSGLSGGEVDGQAKTHSEPT